MSIAESKLVERRAVDGLVTESVQRDRNSVTQTRPMYGVVTGTIIGFHEDLQTPLVVYPGSTGTAPVLAASTIDLHGAHIGRRVILMFENADPRLPVILGLLKGAQAWPLKEQPGQIEVDVDGERLVVTAKEQLVLRCGKASLTLTKSGKVLIEGAYVSHRSSGVIRIKGGSVQIN